MGCQSPPLSNRTAPMPVPGLLPIADLKPHPPDDASQSHDALSPMANCSVAEGEKLRLGGQLPAGAFAPSVGASTPAPQPKLPVQSPTMSVRYYFPKSSVSFLRPDDFDWMRNQWSVSLDEEPITTLLLWGQCQDAHWNQQHDDLGLTKWHHFEWTDEYAARKPPRNRVRTPGDNCFVIG